MRGFTIRTISSRIDSFSMSDIDTLNGIAEWAAYHAHGNIFHSVIRMIHEFNGEGIATDTNLYKRSKFLSVVERIEYINYCDRQSFMDVLAVMDELQETWGDRLLAKVPQFKWLNIRHEIIFEIGIGILRNQIGFDANEWSGSVDDLDIDESFSFKNYKKAIKSLFKSCRKYRSGSSDGAENIAIETEMIDKSTTDLCDILEKKKKVDDETDVISKLKLRILLEKHSLKNLSRYVILFVKNIQNLALPLPELRLVYDNHATADNVTQNMRSPDWTEEQRRSSGPYARFNDSADTAHEGSRRQSSSSAVISERPSRTSTSNQATSSAREKEREKERKDVGRSPDTAANHQSSPMGTDNDSKKNKRKRNAIVRGGEESDAEYVPNGTYMKAQKEFNRMATLKDPLPGIIADMAIAPVASRIVHRRSSRHSGAPVTTEYGETGTRKSPRVAPVNSKPSSARKRQTKKVEEDEDEEDEDEDEDDEDEDEVLTEDQDSIPAKGPRSRRSSVDNSKGKSRRNERSPSPAKGTSSQQKKQLHELEHYMDSTTQVHPKDGKGEKKMRLMDTRRSAERIKFNESEEQVEEIEQQSDSDFATGGGEILQHLKRTAAARKPDSREYPDRLEREWDQVVGARGPRGQGFRRKWTVDQETALNDAVAKHGFGNWISILADGAYRNILTGRTNVNLKDKYRNMCNEK